MARRPHRATLFAVALVALATVLVGACGDENGESATTTTAPNGGLHGVVRDPQLVVGDVTLPDVTGNVEPVPFAMRAEPGRLLVTYFGYTHCPDVCPTSLAALRRAYREIGEPAEQIDTAMVTVDPAADTPTVLSRYLSSFFERYHALRTVDETQLRAAEDAFTASSTITPKPDGTYEVSHTGSTYVVDDQGEVVVEWPFGTSAKQIADDLRQLLETQA